MDPLTSYIIYNKAPVNTNTLNYETLKTQQKDIDKSKKRDDEGKIDRGLLLLSPEVTRKNEERVIYARNVLSGSKPAVVGGIPITEEVAVELRVTAFGTASSIPRGEWTRTPLIMRPPNLNLAYGLDAPRNGARSLLSALQAHVIKWLLFESRSMTKDNKSMVPPETYLRPPEDRQEEALWRACSEIIWRCGGGYNLQPGIEPKSTVVLPGEKINVQHSPVYYHDGVTERLNIFEFKSLEDVQIFIKRYLYLFQAEDGAGALILLYSAIMSRGCENIKKDLDGKLPYLVSTHVEGSVNVVTLLLTGRATPYLHNGVIYVGDEDHYAMPQYGVLGRSPVGLLVWYGNEDGGKCNVSRQYPGSRLKTPAFPIWVTSCGGHYGVLFNTNRELLRNYHAERRFDIHYYTCGGCHVLLNVDTRAQEESGAAKTDDITSTPLEKLIHTKYYGRLEFSQVPSPPMTYFYDDNPVHDETVHEPESLPPTPQHVPAPPQLLPAPPEQTQPPSTLSEPEVDPELLEALGACEEDAVEWGIDINSNLSKRWEPILRKGLKKEVREDIMKNYQFPKNCPLCKPPEMNPEIVSVLTESSKNRDTRIYKKQGVLGGALTILGQAMTGILSKTTNDTETLRLLSEASKLISDCHHAETETRRALVTPVVDKSLIESFKGRDRDGFLFGDKLSDFIKTSKGLKKTGQSIQAASASNNLNWQAPSTMTARTQFPRNESRLNRGVTGGGGRRYYAPTQAGTQRRRGPPVPAVNRRAQTSSSFPPARGPTRTRRATSPMRQHRR